MPSAASAAATEPTPPKPAAPARWSSVRLLRLVERLGAFGTKLRRKVIDLAGGPHGEGLPPAGQPNFDPDALHGRIGGAMNRIIALLARLELRAASARGAARASAPGAAEKRAAAAERRAAEAARFTAETGLDPRYRPLKRPMGTPPPPRRSRTFLWRTSLAALIAGQTDAAVVATACRELAAVARQIGEDDTAREIEALGREILAALEQAALDQTSGRWPGTARDDAAATGHAPPHAAPDSG